MSVLLVLLLLLLGGVAGYLIARSVYYRDLGLPRSREGWGRLLLGGPTDAGSARRAGGGTDRSGSGRDADDQPTRREAGAPPATSPAVAVAEDPAPASQPPDSTGETGTTEVAGTPPPWLGRPEGMPDDLKRISGIGPGIEQTLNELGIHHFRQIAAFTPENIAWVDSHLRFKGRIERENWVDQARALSAEEPGATPGSTRADDARSPN